MTVDILATAWLVHGIAHAQLEYCENLAKAASLPEVTEARGCGDCDDLALWRYERMVLEGVPPENMQISVINGTHAALDVCDWRQCYRLEHGAPVVWIDELPTIFLNPADRHIYQKEIEP
jgi:hypothetical protein